MTKKNIYLVLTILGVFLPYSLFLPWLLEHGYDLPLFLSELFVNAISGTGGLDILAVTLTIIVFVVIEGRRLGVSHYWIPAVGSVLVGVGFGLPLFLYMRENKFIE